MPPIAAKMSGVAERKVAVSSATEKKEKKVSRASLRSGSWGRRGRGEVP